MVDGIKKSDIIDILAGQYNELKLTKAQKLNQMKLIQREAELLKKLADVRKGFDTSQPVVKAEKTSRIAELEKQIRDVQRKNKERGIEMDADNVLNKTAEGKARAREKFLEQKVKQLQSDIKSGDYAKEPVKEKTTSIIPQSKGFAGRGNQPSKYHQVKEVQRPAVKTCGSKLVKAGKQILGLRRIAQTILDVSVIGRQLAKVTFNPRYAKTTGKVIASQKSLKKQNFDRLMDEIHKDEQYHDMVDDGVVYNDLNTGTEKNRNEDYPKSFVYNIPVVKELFLGSNRLADAALNTARFELYKTKRAQLEKQGYFRDTHPEIYKDMGNWVMNMTGRGKMLKMLENGSASRILGNTFYGVRLMASHFNTLNPKNWIDFKSLSPFSEKKLSQYDPVRKEAMKDLMGYAAGVTGTLLALKAAGAEISLDPDDSDFLQARFGDKVYDVSGGLVPYIRTAFRLGEAAMTRLNEKFGDGSEEEASKAVKFAFDSTTRFFRNKLAPNTASITDAMWGENTVGEPFEWTDFLEVYPMYAEEVLQSLDEEGISALVTVAAPNLVGVGYGSYASKANIDVSKSMEKIQKEIEQSDDPAERYKLRKQLEKIEGKPEPLSEKDKEAVKKDVETLNKEIEALQKKLDDEKDRDKQDEIYLEIQGLKDAKKEMENL